MYDFDGFPEDPGLRLNRRHFFGRTSLGLGSMALASLLTRPTGAGEAAADVVRPGSPPVDPAYRGVLTQPHHPPKAKRVIYLFMSGGPSQLDLFDHKPLLNRMNGKDLPDSVRMGQRLTGMSGNQASLPLAGSLFQFARHGKSGTWISELLPHTARVVDELCVIRSVYTEAINHDPAITFFQTGSQIAGRPSMGAWLSYGLGSSNQNLPTFCVLISQRPVDQPLYSRLWGNGFLPSVHQGVQFRAGADPVLYLENPPGISAAGRRKMLDRLRELHQIEHEATLDPAINARIAQYEMAYRMQTSVPEVTNLAEEPEHVFKLYGPDAQARNLRGELPAGQAPGRARRPLHPALPSRLGSSWRLAGRHTRPLPRDRPGLRGLIQDLRQRGMLEDTLVLWGGEFGRTNYSQGKLTPTDYGRDHHPRCFTVWAAGGGMKPGLTYGETDAFGYNIVANPVHVHDFHATVLSLLGIDHERLTYKHQGRYYRLTDVAGKLVKGIMA